MRNTEFLEYDVVIAGGGVSGIGAAISAARMGAKTLLVERNDFLGGAAASGLGILGFEDRGGNPIIGGIPREIIHSMDEMGGTLGHNYCPILNSLTPINPSLFRITAFEKCAQAGADLLLHCEVVDVNVDCGHIASITVFGKCHTYEISGKVFVDCTGDGDMASMAGAHYVKGNGTGEIQPASMIFVTSNMDKDRMLDYVAQHPEEAETPEGYEMETSVDFYKSARGYNFLGFGNIIKKAIDHGDYNIPRDQFSMITSPNKNSSTINNTRIIHFDGSDLLDLTRGTIEAYRQVEELSRFIPKYIPGYENSAISLISPTLGVRESRRFAGIKTLCYEDASRGLIPDDSIALCGYNVDIHHGGDAGSDLLIIEKAYGIPYGCLVSADIDGLLFGGRIISVDWMTFGSSRIMSTSMAIGEAAGTAAALAVKKCAAPADVPVQEIRDILRENGAIVSL